jgi:hypothetical protein
MPTKAVRQAASVAASSDRGEFLDGSCLMCAIVPFSAPLNARNRKLAAVRFTTHKQTGTYIFYLPNGYLGQQYQLKERIMNW